MSICRYKREFASQDLELLLQERDVRTSDLMPWKNFDMRVDLTKADPTSKRLYPPFLALDIFDNTEYDCRQPQEWLNLGVKGRSQKPVPGKALLSITGKDIADPDKFEWIDVGVMRYDPEKKQFFVKVVSTEGIQHNVIPKNAKLNALIDKGGDKATKRLPRNLSITGAWVPRIRLMFCAEDPVVFAERVASAYRLRQQTEALIRYHLYVDCMPVDDVTELEPSSLERMVEWASETSMLKKGARYCLVVFPIFISTILSSNVSHFLVLHE